MTRAASLGLAVVAALLGGGAIAGYYSYAAAHYLSTDYASVLTPTATLSVPAAGTLTDWRAKPDAPLRKGEMVGRVTEATGRSVVIRSPLTGRVTVNYATTGDSVQATQVLAEVGNLTQSVIQGEIPETEAGHLRIGQTVSVRLADDPSVLTGTLTRIGRATLVAAESGPGFAPLTTANATEYVPITVRFPTRGERIVSGMSAALEVHI